MKVFFSEDALAWLRKTGFDEDEVDAARKALSTAWKGLKEGKEVTIKLPKGTSSRVAAIVHAVVSTTDARGWPTGFGKSGIIDIADDVKSKFDEEMEIGTYEDILASAKKIKLVRMLSDAKRRSSVKKERYKSI